MFMLFESQAINFSCNKKYIPYQKIMAGDVFLLQEKVIASGAYR